jgi:hypothetical protein
LAQKKGQARTNGEAVSLNFRVSARLASPHIRRQSRKCLPKVVTL